MPIHPLLAIGAVVLLVLVGVGIAAPAGTAAGAVLEPETSIEVAGIRGHIRFAGGEDGTGARFVTSAEYCRAANVCRSEAILVQAWTDTQSVWKTQLCAYRFKVSISEGSTYKERPDLSTGWFSPNNHGQSQADHILSAPTATNPAGGHLFYLIGPHEGAIKVELEAQLTKGAWARLGSSFGIKDCSTVVLAGDGAQLVRGDGNIVLKAGSSDVFEEGKVASFSVDTRVGKWRATVFDGKGAPVCGAGMRGGFLNSLTAFAGTLFDAKLIWGEGTTDIEEEYFLAGIPYPPKASGAEVFRGPSGCAASVTWDGPRNGAELNFQIPEGTFRADGKNRWTVRLENTLTTYAQEAFFVIDKKAKAPEPPVVVQKVEKVPTPSASSAPAKKTVTFELRSRGNGATGAAVTEFVLYAWYGQEGHLPPSGQSPNWVLNGVHVPATKQGDVYVGTHKVEVDATADLQYRFHSVDDAGRNSGTSLNQEDRKVLEEEGKIENPNTSSRGEVDLDGKKDTPAGPAAIRKTDTGVLLFAFVIVVVLGLGVWFLLPAPPPVQVGAIVLLVGGYAVWAIPKLVGGS